MGDRQTFRERVGNWITGGRLDQVQARAEELELVADDLARAYQVGIYALPPELLARQLMEAYDPQLIRDLIDRMNWETISSYGTYVDDERVRAVADSRKLFKYAILARWCVNLWTFYGLGENVAIVPLDATRPADDADSAQEVWKEFEEADRNQAVMAKDRLDELSRWILVAGERFLAFYASTLDGTTTIRSILPEQITRILCNPEDDSDPWFYERKWTPAGANQPRVAYYPDWQTLFAEVEEIDGRKRPLVETRWAQARAAYTDLQGELAGTEDTEVCILFVPFLQVDETSIRGWPLLAPHGTDWFRAQREFMEDRATIVKATAAYVRRYKVSGGSRAVDAVRTMLQSTLQRGGTTNLNPTPPAGSSEVMNRAVDVEDLVPRSGAGDAKMDSEMFAWNALLAGGIFPHYAGMGDAYRLATATSMERPLELQFSLYRNQLGAMFRKVVRIVLQFKERYSGVDYEVYDAKVSTDQLVEMDMPAIIEGVTTAFEKLVEPADLPWEAERQILVFLVQTVLQALGNPDAADTITVDMFPAEKPPKPEPPPFIAGAGATPAPADGDEEDDEVSGEEEPDEEGDEEEDPAEGGGWLAAITDTFARLWDYDGISEQQREEARRRIASDVAEAARALGQHDHALLSEADLMALAEAEPSTRHPKRNRDALAGYGEEIQGIYDDWAEDAAAQLAEADEEDRDELLAALLLLLGMRLKQAGRNGLTEAFFVGLNGTTATADALAALDKAIAQNDAYIDTSLVPAVRERVERETGAEGFTWDDATLSTVLGGLAWRVKLYKGAFWAAIGLGVGAALMRRGDPPVRRYLDPTADHCETCPPKAREYESWSAMVAEVGIPGDGQDQCDGNCRCGVDAKIDGVWAPWL